MHREDDDMWGKKDGQLYLNGAAIWQVDEDGLMHEEAKAWASKNLMDNKTERHFALQASPMRS